MLSSARFLLSFVVISIQYDLPSFTVGVSRQVFLYWVIAGIAVLLKYLVEFLSLFRFYFIARFEIFIPSRVLYVMCEGSFAPTPRSAGIKLICVVLDLAKAFLLDFPRQRFSVYLGLTPNSIYLSKRRKAGKYLNSRQNVPKLCNTTSSITPLPPPLA